MHKNYFTVLSEAEVQRATDKTRALIDRITPDVDPIRKELLTGYALAYRLERLRAKTHWMAKQAD